VLANPLVLQALLQLNNCFGKRLSQKALAIMRRPFFIEFSLFL